ncbi:PepSY domain-containing protein [Bradyrhizobium sp. Gha]|uniref:PepSY domain-containing protein n=1 Tax=Bradyrhizobium sp. Gha TaxID=1855318 RepID=UPI0008E68991|nr:PepSY domain-containing protein [Bradyrhizobium sp. Gha]SFJ80381.1 Peptidase propeptide and YPEB domain-containing protein [Bradyrhizobium sp. Gha]
MRTSTIYRAALFVALAMGFGFSPAHALTREELTAKIQAAGYSQVKDVKSTAEGTTAKALKDGKPVMLVVDSSGQIKERN